MKPKKDLMKKILKGSCLVFAASLFNSVDSFGQYMYGNWDPVPNNTRTSIYSVGIGNIATPSASLDINTPYMLGYICGSIPNINNLQSLRIVSQRYDPLTVMNPLASTPDVMSVWPYNLECTGSNTLGPNPFFAISGLGNVGIGVDPVPGTRYKLDVSGGDIHTDHVMWVNQYEVIGVGGTSLTTTSTPGTDYNLYVQNGILTEKLKVAKYPSTDWADFVFNNNYKLMPLKTLESFIITNRHLPDVPSAEEVSKNGIDVAKMDATLLQKIEELTLYVVQQQKSIEQLQQENIQLRKEIKSKK